MTAVLLVIHVFVAVAMVGVVLIQRSEGGGLGIGGGGGGGGLMTSRGSANLLTRITAVLAACFFATSLALAFVGGTHRTKSSILDQTPARSEPATPSAPTAPTPPAAPVSN